MSSNPLRLRTFPAVSPSRGHVTTENLAVSCAARGKLVHRVAAAAVPQHPSCLKGTGMCGQAFWRQPPD